MKANIPTRHHAHYGHAVARHYNQIFTFYCTHLSNDAHTISGGQQSHMTSSYHCTSVLDEKHVAVVRRFLYEDRVTLVVELP